MQLLIYISWPTCVDPQGHERLNLFPVASSLLGMAFGCFPNRPITISSLSELLIILVICALGVVGLVVLIYFARASKNARG